MTDLIKKDTAAEIVAHRDHALDCYRRAVELFAEGNAAASRASLSAAKWEFRPSRNAIQTVAFRGDGAAVEALRRELDQHVWLHLFRATGLGDLFDAAGRKTFEEQLETDPPVVTLETVMATALGLAADAGSMIDRSILDLFARLKKRFKSNSGSGFGRRVVLSGAMTWGFLSTYHEAEVRDLERAACIVRSEPVPEHMGGICGAIAEARRDSDREAGETTAGVIKARWYKNGNLHLWITDEDAIDGLNRILARHGELVLT